MTSTQSPSRFSGASILQTSLKYLPGLLLTAVVAWAGLQSSVWIGRDLLGFSKSPISGIMMAILIGLLIGNVVTLPGAVKPGITFSLKRILRLGIILLGIRLGLGDVLRLGVMGIPLIILCITGALLFTRWFGSRLDLPSRMTTLVAVGTSICGATAIVATGPAIEAKEEELTYAVANITIFGIIAMFLYPYIANTLFADNQVYAGLFLGTSIHETAQVAGGGLIYAELFDAPTALDTATITKLVRNVFMAVIIPLMAVQYSRSQMATSDSTNDKRVNILKLFPVFILGFIGMAIFRTVGDSLLDVNGSAYVVWSADQWSGLVHDVKVWAERFLAMAMAGVGLGTSFRQIRTLGIKPFYVGFGASVVVGLLSILGIAILAALGIG